MLDSSGQWQLVEPIPGALTINVGDQCQVGAGRLHALPAVRAAHAVQHVHDWAGLAGRQMPGGDRLQTDIREAVSAAAHPARGCTPPLLFHVAWSTLTCNGAGVIERS